VRFKIARADAIESYSVLKSALSRLFADVLEAKTSLARIVFFVPQMPEQGETPCVAKRI
jgi:hypothetical protein